MKSIKTVILPVNIAGHDLLISTDVVHADIPLLISLTSVKRAQMIINFQTDEAVIFGRSIKLQKTSTGHYSLPLKAGTHKEGINIYDENIGNKITVKEGFEFDEMERCLVAIDSDDDEERRKALKKLHEQMGHLPIEELIKNSGKWTPEMKNVITNIESNCSTCKLYAKTPPKPVVALSRAQKFNEVLSVDLKKWRGKLILYMIDQWSRLTRGCFIKSKNHSEVVDGIWMHWISVGYGSRRCIHSDVGGEFSN